MCMFSLRECCTLMHNEMVIGTQTVRLPVYMYPYLPQPHLQMHMYIVHDQIFYTCT